MMDDRWRFADDVAWCRPNNWICLERRAEKLELSLALSFKRHRWRQHARQIIGRASTPMLKYVSSVCHLMSWSEHLLTHVFPLIHLIVLRVCYVFSLELICNSLLPLGILARFNYRTNVSWLSSSWCIFGIKSPLLNCHVSIFLSSATVTNIMGPIIPQGN